MRKISSGSVNRAASKVLLHLKTERRRKSEGSADAAVATAAAAAEGAGCLLGMCIVTKQFSESCSFLTNRIRALNL